MNHRWLGKKSAWGGLARGVYNTNHRRLGKRRSLQHESPKAWQKVRSGRLGKGRLQHEPSKAWQEEALTARTTEGLAKGVLGEAWQEEVFTT